MENLLTNLTKYNKLYSEISQLGFSKTKEGHFKISFSIYQENKVNYAFCTLHLQNKTTNEKSKSEYKSI